MEALSPGEAASTDQGIVVAASTEQGIVVEASTDQGIVVAASMDQGIVVAASPMVGSTEQLLVAEGHWFLMEIRVPSYQ